MAYVSTAAIDVPADLVAADHRLYAYRVVGESMTPEILDGDYIIVDADQEACDGDIAAVHLTNWEGVSGRVVKRLSRGGTVLESSNPEYPPMALCPEHRPRVLGVVVGVLRVMEEHSLEMEFT